MKKLFAMLLVLGLVASMMLNLSSCGIIPGLGENNNGQSGNQMFTPDCTAGIHADIDNDDYCDLCDVYVAVVIDFYVFNDLHGKFCDTATQPGVDEFGSFIEDMSKTDDNIVLLSSGDMWQGTAESALTNGGIIVDWMNLLGFEAMTLGNHEFDWGEAPIAENEKKAEFPFLAINVYNKSTGKLADYCTPSIMIERDGVNIGIIGAIGDCYSSISSDKVQDVTFKVGSQLTALVMAESKKLREHGADLIVYSVHDGIEEYDEALSKGYVDIVFEGHTHSSYTRRDSYGVYHLQSGGENNGVSHAEVKVNRVNGINKVTDCEIIPNRTYSAYEDHEPTEAIEEKYSDIVDYAYADLGQVSKTYYDSELEDFVAELYLEAGVAKWGSQYNIVLGGGFLKTRTPYNLTSGVKKYADLLSLFPFNNQLVLCSISGKNLKSRFINSTNEDYHMAFSGLVNPDKISDNETYYIVVDTYTAQYAPNRLTIVEYFDNTTYARDLLADAIKEGRL